jgi:hypothetical protein
MARGPNRGKRPAAPEGKLRETTKPPDYNDETPKFCLHYLCGGFDVHALNAGGQAAFAKTLQKLACSKWKELIRLAAWKPRPSGRGGNAAPSVHKKSC